MSKHKNLGTIEKLMDGFNPYRDRQAETRGLVKKWESTGLLEGIDEEQRVHGMAVLLENQARQLIDEASSTGTSANSEEWSGVALPLVRKIFGELAAQEFVSVQPMNLPSGLVFYLDFKYGTAQPGHNKNSHVFGVTSGSGDPTDGLYGAGQFGFSSNPFQAAATLAAAYTSSAVWADVDFEPDLSASAASSAAGTQLKKYDIPVSLMTTPDKEGARAFEISGSTAYTAYYPAYTKMVTGVDGSEVEPSHAGATHVRFIVKETSALSGAAGTFSVRYHKQPVDTGRGDFEASSGLTSNPETDVGIPELDISMRSVAIVAKTRKLKAVWTPELAQDLNAYHSVDAEAELTSLLSEYVSMEIDLEILDMLRLNAMAKTERWSAKVGHEYDSVSTTFKESSGSSNAYTKMTWFQTLGNKIQSVSNAIHQKTLRGGANWLVVSPEVATILESIPGYSTSSDGDSNNKSYAMGVQKAGMLNNRWTVYKNPYQFENTILVGFRGSNFLETGAVYAPYVPLIMTPLVYDPKNFTPRKGVMTRYAKKIVRPEFYGRVIIADINYV